MFNNQSLNQFHIICLIFLYHPYVLYRYFWTTILSTKRGIHVLAPILLVSRGYVFLSRLYILRQLVVFFQVNGFALYPCAHHIRQERLVQLAVLVCVSHDWMQTAWLAVFIADPLWNFLWYILCICK